MRYILGGCTEIGSSMTVNQDSYALISIDTPGGMMSIAMVCDGMGGYEQGELASASIIEAFRHWIREDLETLVREGFSDYSLRESWSLTVNRVCKRIYAYGCMRNIQIGSTICICLVYKTRYYIMNIGDSRLYKIDSCGVVPVTEDHSVVFEEYLAGRISKAEIETDERNHILTRSVGIEESVVGDFYFGDISEDTSFVIMSDGVHHVVTEDELFDAFSPSRGLDREMVNEECCKLLNKAMARGEDDNLTTVVLGVFV